MTAHLPGWYRHFNKKWQG